MMDARVSIVSNNLNVLMKRLAILTVIFGRAEHPGQHGRHERVQPLRRGRAAASGRGWRICLFTLGMGLLGWVCYRVLAFFQVFSVDASPTWRGRRRKADRSPTRLPPT
ncbi:MAG: hypothetical protein MZV70_19075 [Desulfobacterales bacterium]|nr:hypothetical protein [Desulfobacterales bacterium]